MHRVFETFPEVRQLAIHLHANGLKSAARRMSTTPAGRSWNRRLDRVDQITGGHQRTPTNDFGRDPTGKALLAQFGEHGGQLGLGVGVQHLGRGEVLTCVHPHVERRVLGVGEPATGLVELHGGDAEVEEDPVDARVVDLETGRRVLPAGEEGELQVKGPQVMRGYWNQRSETEAVLKDGWLSTGDLVRMDEEGFFYILDRKKDMIKSGGMNVYPREVDECLCRHPKVKEACVVGVPQDLRGEKIKAFVVLKDGEEATAAELLEHCRRHLAQFKVPKQVEFRKELPKTLVGKVLRRVLLDEELKRSPVLH